MSSTSRMIIGICSDSHDSLEALQAAITAFREREITTAFHLGDFMAPFMLKEMADAGEIQWYGVWGNNDGDKLMGYQVSRHGKVDVATGDFRELELAGKKIFLTHYPEIGRIAALSGKYDAVFHGHTHQLYQEVVTLADGREVLLANPGELYGKRTGKTTCMVWDTESNEVEVITL